jgi:nucleotide-binding universal stress UspA family protein
MSAKILVGVEESDRSQDAVSFASRLARATGAELVLANAYPYDSIPSRAAGPSMKEYLRQDAQAMLDRRGALTVGVPHVRTCTIASVSPARALHELAEHDEAAVLVIGSSHRGGLGRVFAGATAERLIHGSPCPVAVVPTAYRTAEETPITTVGIAYDGSDESKSALVAAIAAARAFGASLKVIRVFEPATVATPLLVAGPDYVASQSDLQERARQGLDAAVAEIPDDVPAEGVLVAGDPVRELSVLSESVELMFAGSRGYGPLRAVLAGSVSGRLLRKAACPVIVVPRGVARPLEGLFEAASVGQPA